MFNSALVCDVETFEYNMGFVSLEKRQFQIGA